MNLKLNKHKRILFNTTTMASLGFIDPSPQKKVLGPPLNLTPSKFNLLLRSPLKLGGGCYHDGPKRQGVSVLQFIFPSVCKLSRNCSLFFSETQNAVRGPSIVISDSWIFWKTSLSGENDQKWSKMTQKEGFRTF